MRSVLVFCLAILALWRGWIDLQDSLLRGASFRLASAEDVIRSAMPRGYRDLSKGIEGIGLDWIWAPTVETMLAVPLVVLLGGIAFAIWVTRPLGQGRG